MSRIRQAALVAGGLALTTAVASPAQASASFTTVATGLDNPRGLAFAPNGDL